MIMTRKRYTITLNRDQLELLDDILAYYRLSDFGGGDHSAEEDQIGVIERKVTRQQARAIEEDWQE